MKVKKNLPLEIASDEVLSRFLSIKSDSKAKRMIREHWGKLNFDGGRNPLELVIKNAANFHVTAFIDGLPFSVLEPMMRAPVVRPLINDSRPLILAEHSCTHFAALPMIRRWLRTIPWPEDFPNLLHDAAIAPEYFKRLLEALPLSSTMPFALEPVTYRGFKANLFFHLIREANFECFEELASRYVEWKDFHSLWTMEHPEIKGHYLIFELLETRNTCKRTLWEPLEKIADFFFSKEVRGRHVGVTDSTGRSPLCLALEFRQLSFVEMMAKSLSLELLDVQMISPVVRGQKLRHAFEDVIRFTNSETIYKYMGSFRAVDKMGRFREIMLSKNEVTEKRPLDFVKVYHLAEEAEKMAVGNEAVLRLRFSAIVRELRASDA